MTLVNQEKGKTQLTLAVNQQPINIKKLHLLKVMLSSADKRIILAKKQRESGSRIGGSKVL